MFAAGVGSTTLISSLLEKNADPGRNDIFGRSAIFWAAERGLYAAIDMLARIAGIETADDCWSKFPASRLDQLPTRLDGCGPGAVVMLKPDRFSLPPDEVWVTEHDGCEREDQLEEEMQRCSSRPMSRPHLIVRLKECFPCLRRSNPLARSLACYSLRPGSNMLLEQAPTCFDDPLFSNVNHDLATCKTRLCIVSADGNDLPCAPGKALETGSRKYLVEIVSILTVEDSYLVKYRSLERRDRQCISCGPTV
jgi:ankyrin repeat protein